MFSGTDGYGIVLSYTMFVKNIFVLFVALLVLTTNPSASHAHEVSASDTVEALIHISPNDEPVALQISRIQIEVTDTSKHFDFANCDCTLTVTKENTAIAELPLVGTGTTLDTSYTFADEGEYHLLLSGRHKATASKTFNNFDLSYNYSVKPVIASNNGKNPQTTTTSASPSNLQISVVLLSILVVITAIVAIRKRRST